MSFMGDAKVETPNVFYHAHVKQLVDSRLSFLEIFGEVDMAALVHVEFGFIQG